MALETPEEKAYLQELYTMTQGDTEIQVSMFDVGTAVGLDKDAAGAMAEGLFIQGLAELKTLSGGIGITTEGLKALDISIPLDTDSADLSLGSDAVLCNAGMEAAHFILGEIKDKIIHSLQSYDQIENIVIDIKTIDTQLLSSKPKTAIIREVFISLHETLKKTGPDDLVQKLAAITKS